MKVLITGGSGLLGKSLLETKPPDVDLTMTWHKNIKCVSMNAAWYQLDIRQVADIRDVFLRVRPDVIIHCAAIGSVDYAESHYDEVSAVNYAATMDVIDVANAIGAKVVYISSNAVYSGNLPPYDEMSPTEPVNEYGLIKLQAEGYVRTMAKSWQIIRPFLLYGWPCSDGRPNWASTIISKLSDGEALRLVDDCVWMPTYAPDCAKAIWKLLHQSDKEIYNVAAPERVSLYDFGLNVAKVFGLDQELLKPISSADLDQELLAAGRKLAPRPKDTSYDLLKLSDLGIILSDVMTGLGEMREVGNWK